MGGCLTLRQFGRAGVSAGGIVASAEAVNAVFRAAAQTAGTVIGATDRALVSTDLRARAESIVMACPETRVTAAGMCRVFGWYDNEWGFSNRMLDVAGRI